RPHPPRHLPRPDHLRLRPLGQPLRDLRPGLRHLPRRPGPDLDLGGSWHRHLLPRQEAQRTLPHRGDLSPTHSENSLPQHHRTYNMQTDILNFIHGEYVATGQWFDNRTPTTNAVIGRVAEAGKAEVDAAVAAARAALKGPWGQMPLTDRK